VARLIFVTLFCGSSLLLVAQQSPTLPTGALAFGMFSGRFGDDGRFSIEGRDWSPLRGAWTVTGDIIELRPADTGGPCQAQGRYRFRRSGTGVQFELVADACEDRRIVLDGSTWVPAGEAAPIPDRTITRTDLARGSRLPAATASTGSWPSFRGPQASGVADHQDLPDRWNVQTGENVLWRARIPGLGHSSPVVWGQRIFVTSAVSSDPRATFKPGLYGDGDSSGDRSVHRFVTHALDKRSGKVLWERVASTDAPIDKRHIKNTYASSTPVTDGRVVVSWFGSQGVYAYTVNGDPLWRVDLGRLNLGAYNIPTLEWGTASSPIIWNGLVILQCDTHAGSFIVALEAATGKVVWKTERDELPSWGTPTVAVTSKGPELVTNGSKFVRGYDPRDGRELWRLGRSSLITAPTPIFDNDLFIIASGRAPERPLFAVRAGARGDITPVEGETRNEHVAWSWTARGSYMPSPLSYRGILYVLNNNGVFDAYDVRSGREMFRQRMPEIGSGFSASPVAADGKLYAANEDGQVVVLAAGDTFRHIATNTMDDLVMATPALSDGVMYVRTAQSLIAVGKAQRIRAANRRNE
jgi:outer membrane protein assembly factor BamB